MSIFNRLDIASNYETKYQTDFDKRTDDTGMMSTIITGNCLGIMQLPIHSMGELMNNYSSAYNLKMTNSCIA